MPTYTTIRGRKRWKGQIKKNGKIVRTKLFGTGKAEQRKAIAWEEKEKKRIECEAEMIRMDSLSTLQWANDYLDFSQTRYVEKTYLEKRDCFKRYLLFAQKEDRDLKGTTAAFAMKYLQIQNNTRSGYAANKDRKNLAAAWEWGKKYLDGFPKDLANPFRMVDKFPEIRQPRYVPPIDDFDKIMTVAQGQNRVMLTAFLHLAARRGELFQLTWGDVNFDLNQICLTTRKTKTGTPKRVWLPMSSELVSELKWWQVNRPYKWSKYVFTMLDDTPSPNHNPGGPFKQRRHFMKTICQRADVKPFGFHAIRHISASYLYKIGKPLSLIQKILRHESPSTTERYLKSLGFGLDDLGSAVEEFSNRGKIISLKNKKAS